jgi:hypothetical protein
MQAKRTDETPGRNTEQKRYTRATWIVALIGLFGLGGCASAPKSIESRLEKVESELADQRDFNKRLVETLQHIAEFNSALVKGGTNE